MNNPLNVVPAYYATPLAANAPDTLAQPLVTPQDRLRNGIWPKSIAIWMCAIYMALYLIRPWEVLFPALATVSFERFYVLVMLAVVVSERGFRLDLDRQTATFFVFLAALSVCTITAYDTVQAWSGKNGLYNYIPVALAYFVIFAVVRTPYELIFLITCHAVTVGLYLTKSLWEFLLHGAGRHSMGVWRLRGIDLTFAHPNTVAATIVLTLPICYFLYRMRDAITRSWPPFWKTWFIRCLWLHLAISLVCLLFTNSRGGIVAFGFFVVLLVFRIPSFNQRAMWLVFLAILSLATFLALPGASRDRIRSIFDRDAAGQSAANSRDGRIIGFWTGMEMFRRFPIAGVGVDNYGTYRETHIDGSDLASHNLYAQVLSHTGTIGTIAFVLLIWATFHNARSLRKVNQDVHSDRLDIYHALGAMARDILLLLLLQGLFLHNLYRYNWIWLAAFVAIAWRLAKQDVRETTSMQSAHLQHG